MLKALEPLLFEPNWPVLSIVGQLWQRTGECAACLSREWRGYVETAKELGMYDVKLSVARSSMTAVCADTGSSSPLGLEVLGDWATEEKHEPVSIDRWSHISVG